MGKFQSIDEARAYFKDDRLAMVNGMTIDELTDGGCICSMAIREDHRNAIGSVMGGVLFTLADFAFAVAANQNHHPTVAMDANINFLSASKGTRLIAHTECVKDGKTTCVYQTEIMDDLGRKVALVTGTGYKL